jgi:hypothetical protein
VSDRWIALCVILVFAGALFVEAWITTSERDDRKPSED